MIDRTTRSLDEQLARLATDVEAGRDLWPGVARGIVMRPRRTVRRALAAALASACVASSLTWAVLHGRPAAVPAKETVMMQAISFDAPQTAAFLAVRADLQKAYQERLAQLDTPTRAKIEASLAAIRNANEDIRKALGDQPSDPVLEQLLASTWHEEFDLYERVVQSTQPSQTRT